MGGTYLSGEIRSYTFSLRQITRTSRWSGLGPDDARSTSSTIMATPAFPQTFQLPVELIHALNQTYFLHLLANDPDKVIPPGKSLLSMLAHSHVAFQDRGEVHAGNDAIRERIRLVAQRAFWDEVCL